MSARAAGDVEPILEAMSLDEEVFVIGSSVGEYWRERDAIAAITRVQQRELREIGPVQTERLSREACKEGSVGWVVELSRVGFGDTTLVER